MRKHFLFLAQALALCLLACGPASAASGRDVKAARVGVDISLSKLVKKADRVMDIGGEGFSQLAFIPAQGMETMEIFPIEGWDDKTGLQVASKPSYRSGIMPNIAYLRRMTIPEGLPACQICFSGPAQPRVCWVPAESGRDGSLVLSAGFRLVK